MAAGFGLDQLDVSLGQLPDTVLLQIIARVGLCDAVPLSQTCSRLRHLVLHVPGKLLAPAAADRPLLCCWQHNSSTLRRHHAVVAVELF
jgi:hypothetical protein